MMIYRSIMAVLLSILSLLSVWVWADCQSTGSQLVTFGSVGSSEVLTSTLMTTSLNPAGINCNIQPFMTKPEQNFMRATLRSQEGFRLKLKNGEYTITYTAAAKPNNQALFRQDNELDYIELDIADKQNHYGNLPIYFRVVPGNNIPAGVYEDTLTLHWHWKICTAIGRGATCAVKDAGKNTTTIKVSLTVKNDCQIVVPQVHFGTAAFPKDFALVTASIKANCAKGVSYQLGIDGGDHAISSRRQMVNSKNDALQYDIFVGNSNTLWGDTPDTRVSGQGTQSGEYSVFPFSALIYKDQALKPAGLYQDQVRVNLYY